MKNIRDNKRIISTIVCVLSCFAFTNVSAQDVANGSATANVQTALAIVSTQDLQFGSVFQGVSKTVANSDAAASGIFAITGSAGSGISAYMTLPQYISTATGDDRMNIAFNNSDLSVDSTSNADPSAFGDG